MLKKTAWHFLKTVKTYRHDKVTSENCLLKKTACELLIRLSILYMINSSLLNDKLNCSKLPNNCLNIEKLLSNCLLNCLKKQFSLAWEVNAW